MSNEQDARKTFLTRKQTMKKSAYVALTATCLLITSALTGKAVTYWDIDVFSEKLSGSNPTRADDFDITTGLLGGYDPITETIYSATVWFGLSDDRLLDSDEWVEFKLDGLDFLNPIEVDLGLVSGQVLGQALVSLDSTGTLSYVIQRTDGDFWALGAKLMAEAKPRTVPDGGATLMLLGGALAGIEALRRRSARKK